MKIRMWSQRIFLENQLVRVLFFTACCPIILCTITVERKNEMKWNQSRGEKRRGEKRRWERMRGEERRWEERRWDDTKLSVLIIIMVITMNIIGLIMSNRHSDEDDQNSNLNTHCFSVNTVNNVILTFIYKRFTFKFKRNPLLFPSITNTPIRCV